MGRAPQPYATDSLLKLIEPFRAQADSREKDMLMACGEVISCVLMSHYLRSLGYRSAALDAYSAGVRTVGDHGQARIVGVEPKTLLALLAAGGLPVVAGFQGVNEANQVTTLGRGGSDTTAVAVGAALNAHFVEIYTDVEGVMTADPRILPQAEVLSQINFEEMGELAGEGAKVVHPRAVELADDHGLPLWIKSTFGHGYGTYLSRAVPKEAFERTRVVTGIAHVVGLCQMVIQVGEPQRQAELLKKLAESGINLDLISITDRALYCILRDESRDQASQLLVGETFEVRPDCVKISIVGAGMRGTPGVMARAFGCLVEAGVEVLHTTDSNITISFLVSRSQTRQAVEALHSVFIV